MKQKENLIITLFSDGEKKEAMRIYKEIGSRMSLPRKLLVWAMLPIPAAILRFLIEQAWNYRKKHLFVPV